MSSLIPERHLVVSPSLAATIGLEETVLLSYFADVANFQSARESQGQQWFEVNIQQLNSDLAFWSSADMQRICESLRDKGVLLVASAPLTESGEIRFAFNQSAAANQSGAASGTVSGVTSVQNAANSNSEFRPASRIAPNWQPDSSTQRLLAQQGIPKEFVEGQVPTFVQYWLERGESRHAWGNRFMKQVIREWNRWQAEQNKATDLPWEQNNSSEPMPMKSDWNPSEDALEILIGQAGVSRSFIEDAIPEFVLFWREKGEASNTWNARFITHVKRQWARYQHTVENDVDPKPMSADWKPNQDVYDVLRLARIDLEFAREKIPEFIIYWRDRNEVRSSWNTTYLQFIKHQWQTAHTAAGNQTTRARKLIDDLTDTSWAD
ncbi:MAG: hypothetical protein HOL48_02875 [Porticoccaceae bacterium]|nr:hypothetical protein [Porticoccaceae bacterium]